MKGGRTKGCPDYDGVEVYPDWVESFEKYAEYLLSLGWRDGMVVARKYKTRGFVPGNIVVSYGRTDTQNYKRKRCKLVSYNGEMMSLRDVIRKVKPDADWDVVRRRVNEGWDVETAVLKGLLEPGTFHIKPWSRRELQEKKHG
jgi:hypothetical protein